MITAVAERVRRYRQRKKSGAGVLPFVKVSDEIGTTEMLIASGLLAESQRDDKAANAAAVGKMVDAVVAAQERESRTTFATRCRNAPSGKP